MELRVGESRGGEFEQSEEELILVLGDGPARGCYLLRTPQGALGYTELVPVAGRAAIVSAVGPRVGTLPADTLVGAVRAFADALVRQNP